MSRKARAEIAAENAGAPTTPEQAAHALLEAVKRYEAGDISRREYEALMSDCERVLGRSGRGAEKPVAPIEGEESPQRLDRPSRRKSDASTRPAFALGGNVSGACDYGHPPGLGDVKRLGVEEATRQKHAKVRANRAGQVR